MKYIISVIAMAFVFSCNTMKESPAESASVTLKTQASAVHSVSAQFVDDKAKLIKTANYRFEVKDVKKTSAFIETCLQKYPAYISNSELSTIDNQVENHLIIRVRNEFFEDLLKDIDTQAERTNHRNITTTDVAKEFVDLESRLKTKREVEERFREILRTKTGKIEEVLSAEKQIGDLHEEIEATIAKINLLKDQVSYSTIDLQFYQPANELVSSDNPNFLDELTHAFLAGLDGTMQLIISLTYLWPLIVVGTIGVFYLRGKRKLLGIPKVKINV